ncbi:hypothetical protein MLD38_003203 [Melastoma candidum]|uniref:Uncharacterized protein n=1 Tax=Melastoma candidum TaxID=119954 RepID=A0ACB9S2H6_9MYRT|nr:hypothetical protein MLD38_003203 [Melastoma candidum]
MITQTPLEKGQTIITEAKEVLNLFDGLISVDTSHARALVMKYIEGVSGSPIPIIADEGVLSNAAEEISLAEARLTQAKESVKSIVAHKATLSEQMADVTDKISELRKELAECIEAESLLKILFHECSNQVDEAEAEVLNLSEIVSTLEATRVVSEAESLSSQESHARLMKIRQDIMDFSWKF